MKDGFLSDGSKRKFSPELTYEKLYPMIKKVIEISSIDAAADIIVKIYLKNIADLEAKLEAITEESAKKAVGLAFAALKPESQFMVKFNEIKFIAKLSKAILAGDSPAAFCEYYRSLLEGKDALARDAAYLFVSYIQDRDWKDVKTAFVGHQTPSEGASFGTKYAGDFYLTFRAIATEMTLAGKEPDGHAEDWENEGEDWKRGQKDAPDADGENS